MIKKYIKKCEMYSMIISILMIVLSLCLIFKPVKSIETFVLLFSIIMLVNGVIGVVTILLLKVMRDYLVLIYLVVLQIF